MSSKARDQSWEKLPTRLISPFGTCQTVPFTSRIVVVRSETASTVPVTGPTSITSPTPNWSSMSMNSPDMKSLTMVCEPKPTATPTMPAPASSGPILMSNTPRIIRPATPQATAEMMLESTDVSVLARACERLPSSWSPMSSAGPCARRRARRVLVLVAMMRSASERTPRRARRLTINAPSAISTTFRGFSTTHSVAVARNSLSVRSNTQRQVWAGSRPQASVSLAASSSA